MCTKGSTRRHKKVNLAETIDDAWPPISAKTAGTAVPARAGLEKIFKCWLEKIFINDTRGGESFFSQKCRPPIAIAIATTTDRDRDHHRGSVVLLESFAAVCGGDVGLG
jgi:hypothetical protein